MNKYAPLRLVRRSRNATTKKREGCYSPRAAAGNTFDLDPEIHRPPSETLAKVRNGDLPELLDARSATSDLFDLDVTDANS